MQEIIRDCIQRSVDAKSAMLADPAMLAKIEDAVERTVAAFRKGGKVLFCGNGGSAADAQHLSAEFTGRFYKNREPLFAEALHVNTSYLTAVANDYSFEEVYARLVRGFGAAGDILYAMSTSGNSPNIINAVAAAKERGMIVFGFTGEGGGKMKDGCDILFNVPSSDTPRIQECHMLIGHTICQLTESEYFKN